ncbi:MAG: hypothetical protein ACOCP8_01585 [archaeon]
MNMLTNLEFDALKRSKEGDILKIFGRKLRVEKDRNACDGCYFRMELDGKTECALNIYLEDIYLKRIKNICLGDDGSFIFKDVTDVLDNKDIDKNDAYTEPDDIEQKYFTLYNVLMESYEQSAMGKGKERHASNNNFEDQVICQVQRLLYRHPFGGDAYQVIKKIIEAGRLYDDKGWEAAYNEVKGAIVYAAAMGHLIKEYGKSEQENDNQ